MAHATHIPARWRSRYAAGLRILPLVALMTRVLKRVIIGNPVSTEQAGHTLLAKRLALPIFASDALSSVAYATQEILLVLTLGGTAFLYLAPWVAVAVVVENGGNAGSEATGGTVAAPIAKAVMQAVLAGP